MNLSPLRDVLKCVVLLLFSTLMMTSLASCGDDDDDLTDGTRYPVSKAELTPQKGKLFYLWGEYNSNNFRQYYCLYYYDIDIDLSSYGIDVPSGFTSGFKGSWDGNQKKTVYTRSFSYTFNNSILTITFDKEKSQEVLKVQKVHNRTLQNGDKIYLNESPFTVQIENTPI